MKHDAILKNSSPYPFNENKALGYIFGDTKNRFDDGEQIVTSFIIEYIRDCNDVTTHIVTKSGTVYKLVYGDMQDNSDV
ncbi:hypothetical protein AP1_0201 [Aeromonas phage AP1]|uniref:Uncharacterized protein n=1 Tax=Aeromonas phage vB_AdhaM_G2 TaxID=3238786 RepID=A0AB39TYL8_9CAUD|nr:hypothetical protein AP1_0201 [Aeromonas phage AP1]